MDKRVTQSITDQMAFTADVNLVFCRERPQRVFLISRREIVRRIWIPFFLEVFRNLIKMLCWRCFAHCFNTNKTPTARFQISTVWSRVYTLTFRLSPNRSFFLSFFTAVVEWLITHARKWRSVTITGESSGVDVQRAILGSTVNW